MQAALCTLHLATGGREECPGPACGLWEEGGAVVDPGCPFDRVRFDIEERPNVARWLLALRTTLEDARTAEETARARSALNAVLPPGLHE